MFDGCKVAMAARRDLDGVPMLIGAYGCIRPRQFARSVCAGKNVASDLKRTRARLR